MKKILTMGFVALMTAATVAASTAPASAGGGHHGHGHHNRHNWHGGWNGGWRHDPWRAHVRWCSNRYYSYNPATNRFINSHGRWRTCRSPFI
jgi:hypothetical protein